MLTNNDIAKLAKVVATKGDILDINDKLNILEENQSKLLTTVDNLTKIAKDLLIEYKVLTRKDNG